VVARQPILLPIMRRPVMFVGRQVILVRIEVDLVGIDADAQLARATGLRKEARLEPDRQHEQRLLGGAQRLRHGRRKRRTELRQLEYRLEEFARDRRRHGGQPGAMNCEAWIATRTGRRRRIPAMVAEFLPQLSAPGLTPCGGPAASARWLLPPVSVPTSSPKRGSVGCS